MRQNEPRTCRRPATIAYIAPDNSGTDARGDPQPRAGTHQRRAGMCERLNQSHHVRVLQRAVNIQRGWDNGSITASCGNYLHTEAQHALCVRTTPAKLSRSQSGAKRGHTFTAQAFPVLRDTHSKHSEKNPVPRRRPTLHTRQPGAELQLHRYAGRHNGPIGSRKRQFRG